MLKEKLKRELVSIQIGGRPDIQEQAKKIIEQKINEKMYKEGDDGAIFSPQGTDLGGYVYRTKAVSLIEGSNFFLVPEKVDENMRAEILEKHGVHVVEGNVIGKGSASTIRIAQKLMETEVMFVAFKKIQSRNESAMYDMISPENDGVLVKEGYCGVEGTRGLFLELAVGDCKNLHKKIKSGKNLGHEEAELLAFNLTRRYVDIIHMMHANKDKEKNPHLSKYVSTKSVNHHDVKPSNLMIVNRNGMLRIAIGDLQKANTEEYGIDTGDRAYAAPEHGNTQADSKKADVYSLGLTCLDLVKSMDGELAKKLTILFTSLVEKEPSKRYELESIKMMLDSLGNYHRDDEEVSNMLKKVLSE